MLGNASTCIGSGLSLILHQTEATHPFLERQNKAFKYDYLEGHKHLTLSSMLSVLLEEFLPDKYFRYGVVIETHIKSLESVCVCVCVCVWVGVEMVKEEELEGERVTHLLSRITDQMTKKYRKPPPRDTRQK